MCGSQPGARLGAGVRTTGMCEAEDFTTVLRKHECHRSKRNDPHVQQRQVPRQEHTPPLPSAHHSPDPASSSTCCLSVCPPFLPQLREGAGLVCFISHDIPSDEAQTRSPEALSVHMWDEQGLHSCRPAEVPCAPGAETGSLRRAGPGGGRRNPAGARELGLH